jgi:isoleucyl-tRNA synthetase
VLELARTEKRIGHPLDADVTLWCGNDLKTFLAPYGEMLSTVFITSMAHVADKGDKPDNAVASEIEGLAITVARADAEKCQRCWIYDPTVGEDSVQPELCSRCRNALAEGAA